MSQPKKLTKQEILKASKLTLPLELKGKALFDKCKKHGFTRYVVSKDLLEISNTTGRTVSLSDQYVVKIDESLNVSIDKVTSVK